MSREINLAVREKETMLTKKELLAGFGKIKIESDTLVVHTSYKSLAGAVAAALVTWFTFLPSFLFILIGGPLVESTHNDLKFTAPLTAITAAVVGVILNLALFFAYHVLWPKGFDGVFDGASAVIAAAAALALFRFKRGVMEVIAASAVAGLLVRLAGL